MCLTCDWNMVMHLGERVCKIAASYPQLQSQSRLVRDICISIMRESHCTDKQRGCIQQAAFDLVDVLRQGGRV